MDIYPAIDLYNHKVVRLTRGDYHQCTVYHEHPEVMAKEWEDCGAQWIHVVDLEGARDGVQKNFESLKKIKRSVNCKIQFGGGLRSLEQIQRILDCGVERVVIGTRAIDEDFLKTVLDAYGPKIAVGLDLKEGIVKTNGWLDDEGMNLESAIDIFNRYNVQTIIYTDIQRDGMLQGPNLDGLRHILKVSKVDVILSGGVSKLNDVEACSRIMETNFIGMIVGKALYEKLFSLKEAIKIVTLKDSGGLS